MYNMWSKDLLQYLLIRNIAIDIDSYTEEELKEMAKKAIYETIHELAWEMMCTNNLSYGEAMYIIAAQLGVS